MTGPSLMIGLALALAAAAYVIRPFRAVRQEDWGRSLERWVAAARMPQTPKTVVTQAPDASSPARFCRECGHTLAPDSRFCSACGTPVEGQRQ